MTDEGSVGSWSDFGSLDRKTQFSMEKDEEEEASHQEHLRLAGIVKGVHADLRKKYKNRAGECGLEQIWFEHCQNKPVLSEYADAMHNLATNHWTKNNQETRIDWCRDAIVEYFKQDGLKKVLEKEKRRKERELEKSKTSEASNVETVLLECSCDDIRRDLNNTNEDYAEENAVGDNGVNPDPECVIENTQVEKVEHVRVEGSESSSSSQEDQLGAVCQHFIQREYNVVDIPVQGRIRLLDVGSCFNPFLAFPEFQPIGIDISPAAETVFHCDFLHLRTTDPLQVANDTMTAFINNLKDPVEWLPRECFHVVVFSLLLEYFPAPYQRWVSCQKAHELLMFNGILVIVTPDSSHQNRNAAMIKSWKIAIESLGFKRWRYVKLEHLHCMVFRKVVITEEEKKENFLRGITADMLYIPQDFHDIPDEYSFSAGNSYSYEDERFFRDYTLHELPGLVSDSDENDE